jgi:hypothetical protein
MDHHERRNDVPPLHAAFLQTALPRLQGDERLVAVAAGGSFLTGGINALLRRQVLGPLALHAEGARPSGVRNVETHARPSLRDLLLTTALHDRRACVEALRAAVSLYRRLRTRLASAALRVHPEAEAAVLDYVAEIENIIGEADTSA